MNPSIALDGGATRPNGTRQGCASPRSYPAHGARLPVRPTVLRRSEPLERTNLNTAARGSWPVTPKSSLHRTSLRPDNRRACCPAVPQWQPAATCGLAAPEALERRPSTTLLQSA